MYPPVGAAVEALLSAETPPSPGTQLIGLGGVYVGGAGIAVDHRALVLLESDSSEAAAGRGAGGGGGGAGMLVGDS